MGTRSQRSFQMKNGHITAIVVGIILFIMGLYFIFGLSDVKTGLVMTLVGTVFIIIGILIKKNLSKKE